MSSTGIIAAVAVLAIAVYPLLSMPARHWLNSAISWAVVVPVAIGLRRSPPPLRVPWLLVLVGMVVDAVGNVIFRFAPADSTLRSVAHSTVPVITSLFLLAAAVGVMRSRARNDIGGLIDAALAALALGGVVWTLVLLPQMDRFGRSDLAAGCLAVIVMLLAATVGALLRLLETDTSGNVALRLLLAAVAADLGGFILVGGWPVEPWNVLGMMLFLTGYAALALASLHPSHATLARTGPSRADSFGPRRLAFLALTLLAVPLVAGLKLLTGGPVDGTFVIVSSGMMIALVMARMGLLGRELDRTQTALTQLAMHDPLTGALNRRGLTEVLAQESLKPQRLLVVLCDLDKFKEVNDLYGHTFGDHVLAEVARRLRDCIRPDDALCRLGGDEFVMVILNAHPRAAAELPARVAAALREPILHAGTPVQVTAAVGCHLAELTGREQVSVDVLIAEADAAMYADKRNQ